MESRIGHDNDPLDIEELHEKLSLRFKHLNMKNYQKPFLVLLSLKAVAISVGNMATKERTVAPKEEMEAVITVTK
jgi:hypothetical protein